MSHAEDGPDDAVALAQSERQVFETRIAKLERMRTSVDQLVRFQVEAYKTRIAELKRMLARERAERQALARELAVLRGERQALQSLLRRIEQPRGTGSAKQPEGDEG